MEKAGKIEGKGGERRKFGGVERRGWELQTENSTTKLFASKTQKLNCLQRHLNIFIASIYMENRKLLKERMRIVCCLCYRNRQVFREESCEDREGHP